jgi:hypothetical protein
MAFVHGKRTIITVATKDISPYCNTSEFTKGADKHDTTGYGKDNHVFEGGLLTGEFVCGGTYDNTASIGPHNALDPLVGTVVTVTRKPEGSGTGRPLQTFTALLEEYKETSPVADMVKWSAKFTVSDVVVATTLP